MGNLKAVLVTLVASAIALQEFYGHASLSDSFEFYWGPDRGKVTGPDSMQLGLTRSGEGSGIKSKLSYMYGSITIQIKLVQGNSAGTVTTFYLSSNGDKHDEIDFEFLGNSTGEPYTIHTNIFTQGYGQREEQFRPWFDASNGYHSYTIQWTPYSVVWIVDNTPIRVFRNFHDKQINFPDAQPMNVYASLWDADDWATQGGRVKTDWKLAPFHADFQKYNGSACICTTKGCVGKCSSKNPANWWTNQAYAKLSDAQIAQMNNIRNNYMIYDYCKDTARYNGSVPKECSLSQY